MFKSLTVTLSICFGIYLYCLLLEFIKDTFGFDAAMTFIGVMAFLVLWFAVYNFTKARR